MLAVEVRTIPQKCAKRAAASRNQIEVKSRLYLGFSIVLLMASMQHLDAFAPSLSIQRPPSVPTNLFMSEEPEMGAENPEAAEAGEPVEEEVPEDPEIVALKEEIAKLESELKSKQSTLAYTQDQVEEYSKTGYARKVAEMENMRRVRNVSEE